MAKAKLACQACGKSAARLGMRDTDGLFVCLSCTPSSTWKMYKGSKQRAVERARKAEQARKNFGR